MFSVYVAPPVHQRFIKVLLRFYLNIDMGRICCVPGCKSGKEVPSHYFPKDPERWSKWVQSLKLDHFKNYTSNEIQKNKVCHKHFRPEGYSPSLHRRVLLNVAVPVLFIRDDVDAESNKMHYISQQQQSVIDISEYAQQSQDPPCANNKDMSVKKSNNFEEHNMAIAECKKLTDCSNIHEKAYESSVSEQDKINSILLSRMKALEMKMQGIQNAIQKRPQLQEITRSRNLSPTCRRLYEINIKMKRRNRYLKRLIYNNKQQKKRRTVPIVPSTSDQRNNIAAVRDNFVRMILRNNDVLPQVLST